MDLDKVFEYIKQGIELGVGGQINLVDADMVTGPTTVSVGFGQSGYVNVEAEVYYPFHTPYFDNGKSFYDLLNEVYEKAAAIDKWAVCFTRCYVFGYSHQPEHYYDKSIIHLDNNLQVFDIEPCKGYSEEDVLEAFTSQKMVIK